jgi:hypothetical protein
MEALKGGCKTSFVFGQIANSLMITEGYRRNQQVAFSGSLPTSKDN